MLKQTEQLKFPVQVKGFRTLNANIQKSPQQEECIGQVFPKKSYKYDKPWKQINASPKDESGQVLASSQKK